MDALDAISDPRRREILRLVWNVERSAGDIASRFSISFSAISQHLAALLRVGAVTRRREGKHQYYRANPEALGPFAAALEQFWGDRLAALKSNVESEVKRAKR